jgi:hypothetical protein
MYVCNFVMSVRPSTWNNSAPTGRVFRKLDIAYFGKFVEKIQVSLKCDKNNGNVTRRRMYIFSQLSLISS